MTTRPVFSSTSDTPWFTEVAVPFQWVRGQHYTRRRMCADALYMEAADRLGTEAILEASTYSRSDLGRSLSAMNLVFQKGPYEGRTVEHAYQASKVFAMGGPFTDILDHEDPREAKRDTRLTSSGRLMGFDIERLRLDVTCGSSAYDALYLAALAQNQDTLAGIVMYQHFTDIAFNPTTMLATQARSLAIAVGLVKAGIEIPDTPRDVYELVYNDTFRAPTDARQYALF